MANVIFKVGTKALFDALEQKDTNTLYWLEDVQELYKGNLLFATGKAASQTAAGLMSAEDKVKLDNLSAGTVAGLTPVDATIVIADGEEGTKTIGVQVSKVEGNTIEIEDDGLYVAKDNTEYAIEKLDVADEAVSGQVVSAVVETDGKIAVSRRALVADDIPTLAIAKVEGLQDALDGKAVESDITDAIAALDVEDSAVDGQVVSAVAETDGKITVTRRALVANDIPELAQNKITGLTTALAGKQDNITFETAYDASTNKAATMTDVDAAETAAKEYTDTALTWGSF